MFPHHENELAQSEAATGQPFVKYWMHNGLTRIRTKLPSGEWADEKMSGSLGNVRSAKELVETWGAEVLRYLLISTHYRRPIEFTDEVLSNSRKGLAVFTRLFERVERLAGKPMDDALPDIDQAASTLMETEVGAFVRQIVGDKMRFLEMMDDDFNTAGAIAVFHEIAGATNSFLEQNRAEVNRRSECFAGGHGGGGDDPPARAGAGAVSARDGGQGEPQDQTKINELMALLIQLRNDARKEKQFGIADAVRNGLKKIGITLEDRADGTGWRKE